MSDVERTTTDDRVAIVTINRPERRNPEWGPL
jgi:enoyl-CoA hydratase/carnithine racemase